MFIQTKCERGSEWKPLAYLVHFLVIFRNIQLLSLQHGRILIVQTNN